MLLSFLSTSKFEAAQNEAESEHDGELRRASRLNNAKRLIKAVLLERWKRLTSLALDLLTVGT